MKVATATAKIGQTQRVRPTRNSKDAFPMLRGKKDFLQNKKFKAATNHTLVKTTTVTPIDEDNRILGKNVE
jgi:hypothetical protein